MTAHGSLDPINKKYYAQSLLMLVDHRADASVANFHTGSSEFGLVVRAAGWHAGVPGSIFGRNGL
jgi:hypothetical protein